MNSVLTKPKTLQELYKTYFSFANKFEFTSLLRNYIQSEEWHDTSKDNVWAFMEKVADDIGAVLTDDIVNYTRNVVDINTCKVPQMIEQARMLSYNLDNIYNSYDFFPAHIKCLVDIFSINPEYLLGNEKNHILSDQVIKEILVYIRNNMKDKTPFTNSNVVDVLIDNPHQLTNLTTYKMFVQELFYRSIVEALSMVYSENDAEPMAFNMFHEEIDKKDVILGKLDTYKSWVDKFISNEIEHPLNDSDLANTLWDTVETTKAEKRMSSKFNPFKIADHIYFNGLNPDNKLSSDELDLVEQCINYHSRNKYIYADEQFSSDETTRFAYYKELEFVEWVKLVMYVINNLNSFDLTNLSYSPDTNLFSVSASTDSPNCLRTMQLFNYGTDLVKDDSGNIVLNHEMILKAAKFLCDYVFYIQGIRENIKTVAQKHAMRGSAALLVHIVNDYLIKELPVVRDKLYQTMGNDQYDLTLGWEANSALYNYANVAVVEYMDDNDYFNIDPTADVTYTQDTNARYWEQLEDMEDDDSLGVLTKGQIKDFYRNTLGMGRLQPKKPSSYDDICDFLVDLFKTGANPIKWTDGEIDNPIDDIINKSEEDYGYTKAERLEVQQNTTLRENQEEQFKEYSGNEDLIADEIYTLANNRIFYWKNSTYSSHMLHPFMYNLKLWNKLNNIIINGYRDYLDEDFISYLSSKTKFNQLFGEFGEAKNFWKYNVQDLTGYMTRYEAAIKNEHKEDDANSTSELTGYDGLFYPKAAQDYLDLYNAANDDFILDSDYLDDESTWEAIAKADTEPHKAALAEINDFKQAIYSIYWQTPKIGDTDSFYTKWYSHLNYEKTEYQKIAMQLWYWRDRIKELITTFYPITKYCLDIQGNSLILVSTFKDGEETTNPYLIDLKVAQNRVEDEINENGNIHVSTCENKLVKPSEFWIRWKSNPIAIPLLDAWYDQKTNDDWFDTNYRTASNIELGQLTYMNNDANEGFALVVKDWNNKYGDLIGGNKVPTFWGLEQSANILALSSWRSTLWDTGMTEPISENHIYFPVCSKNPFHILSIEDIDTTPSGYILSEYADSVQGNVNQNGCPDEYGMLFEDYHYCQANGSILIPFYKFVCTDNDAVNQNIIVRLFVIPAQELKNGEFVSNSQINEIGDIEIDLNKKVDFTDNLVKYRFDHQVKVCRFTNVVFSTYDNNYSNRVRFAFLGNFIDGNEISAYKVNSCEAKTRYEFDSQSTKDLALQKDKYYTENKIDEEGEKNYIDTKIAEDAFNSYDSLDKHVLMIEFTPSIDNATLFGLTVQDGIQCSAFNILGDAGYIPHFAYQSLVQYNDKNGGISYTWKNAHLKDKDHLSFELLGLDDKDIPLAYETMEKLVVEDLTDDCHTLLCPQKLIEDIYRIWCNSLTDKQRQYFLNEYKAYTNPELNFNGQEYVEWEDDDGFEIELSRYMKKSKDEMTEDELISEYRDLLDEYYVTILRTENGEIQNEKRYILPPTPISNLLFDVKEDDVDWHECNLNDWQSATISDDGLKFVHTQVVFTGTRNPFNYDEETGEKIYSRPETLQYGNSICGVGGIKFRVEIYEDNGKKYIKPIVRFIKFNGTATSLGDKVQLSTDRITAGDVKVIFSHRNVENLAKYHIVNKNSNLYFRNSLPEIGDWIDLGEYPGPNGEYDDGNHFKWSDFRCERTVELIDKDDGNYESAETDDDGNPLLSFNQNDAKVVGRSHLNQTRVPPYYVTKEIKDDNGKLIETQYWFLEQSELVSKGKINLYNHHANDTVHTVTRDIASPGKFIYAHLMMANKPKSYLDYLYIKNNGLAFKINEESYSIFDALGTTPPFHIDEQLKNKLDDLNDVQILKQYSTFIHESENPEDVEGCGSFNPMQVDAVLKYGILQEDNPDNDDSRVIKLDGYSPTTFIELDNLTGATRLSLQLEDGEVDDLLKIYTNYVKIDDGNGDFHYDLYFNIQNLFNSPFEYISSITNQPNVLILKDSYLYLTGDKYSDGVIDEDKVEAIKEGGTLTIYGQVKTYSEDVLTSAKTIKLFQYQIYNISDDKPKFLINKTYDITKLTLLTYIKNNVTLEFGDVLWTLTEEQLTEFKNLNEDVYVIQPLFVRYNYNPSDDYRINSISFDIMNDVIDFDNVPELCGWDRNRITLKKADNSTYYDRWSDKYMTLQWVEERNCYNLTLKYDEDCGFNFETIYLRWKLPKGFHVMDTIDRLGGYSFSSTAKNIKVICNNQLSVSTVDVRKGYVTNRVPEIGTSYLGLEHSTTNRFGGYVLVKDGLTSALKNAITEDELKNRTLNHIKGDSE